MNSQPVGLSSKEVNRTHEEIRSPELGPAHRRERLLARVRAASRRLPQTPSSAWARIR
jgi:hypothetical protein